MKTAILDFFIVTAFIALMIAGEHYGIDQALNVAIFYAWSKIAIRALIIMSKVDNLIGLSGKIKIVLSRQTFYTLLFASQILATVFYGWFWLSGFMFISHLLLQSKYSEVIKKCDSNKEDAQE